MIGGNQDFPVAIPKKEVICSVEITQDRAVDKIYDPMYGNGNAPASHGFYFDASQAAFFVAMFFIRREQIFHVFKDFIGCR